MNRLVIDTNVLIAGLHSQYGASYEILRLAGTDSYDFVLSVPLVFEYESVAKRLKRQLGLTATEIDDLIDYLCSVGIHHEIHYLWRPQLRDPNDEMILELAVSAEVSAIVTHNVKDFSGSEKFGIEIITPKEFLHRLRKTS